VQRDERALNRPRALLRVAIHNHHVPSGDLSAASVLEALHRIALTLHGTPDLPQLAQLVAGNARQLLDADDAVLYLWDPETKLLRLAYGENSGHAIMATMHPDEGAIGQAFESGEPVVITDYPNWDGRLPEIVERGVKRMAAVPLKIDTRTVGVLAVRFKGPRGCEPEHVQALQLLAAPVAAMLEASVARQRAEAGEARLAAIVDNLPCGVLVRDAQGRAVLLNATGRRMGGRSVDRQQLGLEDIDRIPVFHAATGRRLAEHELPTVRALNGEDVVDCEVRLSSDREEATWMRISAVALWAEDHTIRGAVAIFSDVTRERQLVHNLHATAQENSRLMSELRNAQQRLEEQLQLLRPNHPVEEHENHLTSREREVLTRVGRGDTNRQIGAELGLSPGTVKKHVEHILRKLGAADRTQAAVRAAHLGLVDSAKRSRDGSARAR
jgi:DNA-binding CsgD family transcriptional regulator/PAS domain-containing protein